MDLSSYIFNLYQTDAEDSNTNQIEKNKSTNIEESSNNQVDYGKGIVTKRLWKEKIHYLNDNKDEEEKKKEEEFEDDEEDSVFKNYDLNFEDKDDYRIFTQSNSNELIKKALNFNHKNKKVTILKVLSFLWILLVCVFSGIQNQYATDDLNSYTTYKNMIHLYNQRFREINYIFTNIEDLLILNQGVYSDDYININNTLNSLSDSLSNVLNLTVNLSQAKYQSFIKKQDDEMKMVIFNRVGEDYIQTLTYEDSIILVK